MRRHFYEHRVKYYHVEKAMVKMARVADLKVHANILSEMIAYFQRYKERQQNMPARLLVSMHGMDTHSVSEVRYQGHLFHWALIFIGSFAIPICIDHFVFW